MRPPGEIRRALMQGLGTGPATSRELAARTRVGRQAATTTLSNMVRAGVVRVVEEVRVPEVKRPVPVYELASTEPASSGPDWSVIDCWASWPAAPTDGPPQG